MNKKRILISAMVGTIAFAALSVSLTLAWYGASDRLAISGLDVSVFSTADLTAEFSPAIYIIFCIPNSESISFTGPI